MAKNTHKNSTNGRTQSSNPKTGSYVRRNDSNSIDGVSGGSHRTQSMEVRPQVRDIINRRIVQHDNLWKELAKR